MLIAVFLVGLATLSSLPPWEGADETAHWSYIQELADLGRAPRAGVDTLSADIARYPGPRPYGDTEPYDQTGYPTYRSFREAPVAIGAVRPTRFQSSEDLNWEAQHPPLYYALMVPIYHAVHALPFRDHLQAIRFASWLLAFAGLAIGVLATLYIAPDWAKSSAPLMAAWPFMAPQFFLALARIGNDALCLLLGGLVWLLVLRLSRRLDRPVSLLMLGVALGLGLLTKAFFAPITVGVAAYLVFLAWRSETPEARVAQSQVAQSQVGKSQVAKSQVLRGGVSAMAVVGIALAIGGWWYLAQYGVTHDLTGGGDFVALKRNGGLASGLAAHGDPIELARGFAAMAATLVWTGSWSLAKPPEVLILGPLLLVAIPVVTWATRLKTLPPLAWAPLFLVVPLLLSLCYHIVAYVALTGRGASTPGYYLHILSAPMAFAVSLGWRKGVILPALWLYTAVFTLGLWALETSMFSGCAAKLRVDPHFSFKGATCLVDLRQLSELGHPVVATSALGLAAIVIVLVVTQWRSGPAAPRERLEPQLTRL
jgi:hypothetical protein